MRFAFVDPAELTQLRLPTGFSIPPGKPCRIAQIDGFAPTPCGGTHIRNLGELLSVTATKIKGLSNPTIFYTIAATGLRR